MKSNSIFTAFIKNDNIELDSAKKRLKTNVSSGVVSKIHAVFNDSLSCSLMACRVGDCVVEHPPSAQIFLRLRRGLVCVDA